MNTDIIKIIGKLSGIPGVSGDERLVRNQIIEMIKDHCEYEADSLGNLIAYKKGAERAKNRIMLSAHMDEVGLIVMSADDSGLLRFSTVGGIDNRVIHGKSVEIGENRVYGVIGAKALHHLDDKEKDEPLSADKLYIDIGALGKDDALKHVRPGDRAVFTSAFTRLGDDKILGRAFDDRAGCALLIALIQSELACDCVFAFTVQEETGGAGAAAAAYTIEPNISVVVEATTASDIAGTEPDMVVCELGKGAVLSFMDRGAVYDAELYHLALKIASDNGIPCQPKAGVFGGNESGRIQTSRGGVHGMAVSLPCRYIHTPQNMLCTADVLNTFELLKKLIPTLAGYTA